MDTDIRKAYHKTSATVRWGKRKVVLDIPIDVFSSHQLDLGTSFLLRRMTSGKAKGKTALDVGCGYGAIALYLAATGISNDVLGIDRDALATAFAAWNAERNGVKNVTFQPGLVYDGVGERRFDLLAANVPAKAGEGVHRLFLLGAQDHLTPDGEVWIVVVRPLEGAVDAILDHENIELRGKDTRPGHVVYRYAFRGPAPIPERPYDRGLKTFRWKSTSYRLQAWHGLPEFDSLSVDTELCFELLATRLKRERVTSIAVWNPGHGHLPVFLGKASRVPIDLRICARDVLAVEATRRNLELNEFPGRVEQRVSIDPPVGDDAWQPELIVGRLSAALGDRLSADVVIRWFADHPDCQVIVSGRAASCHRVEQRLVRHGIEVVRRLKRKGFGAAHLRRR